MERVFSDAADASCDTRAPALWDVKRAASRVGRFHRQRSRANAFAAMSAKSHLPVVMSCPVRLDQRALSAGRALLAQQVELWVGPTNVHGSPIQ